MLSGREEWREVEQSALEVEKLWGHHWCEAFLKCIRPWNSPSPQLLASCRRMAWGHLEGNATLQDTVKALLGTYMSNARFCPPRTLDVSATLPKACPLQHRLLQEALPYRP